MKIMIDSGNTVGDLVSEEFAQRMGLDGDEVQDHITVPTTATATTVLVVKRCQEITAKLEVIEGDFIMRPLVVRGLKHPVDLGQHSWAATGAAWISPRYAPSWVCGGSQYSWWADRPAKHKGPAREGGLEGQEGCRRR